MHFSLGNRNKIIANLVEIPDYSGGFMGQIFTWLKFHNKRMIDTINPL